MTLWRRLRPYHRRDWRRLWRYCRCGWPWRCPDSAEMIPAPYRPLPPLPPVELTESERAEIRSLTPDTPPPSARSRADNRRPAWNAPTQAHLTNGRPGSLTPAQQHRARHSTRT